MRGEVADHGAPSVVVPLHDVDHTPACVAVEAVVGVVSDSLPRAALSEMCALGGTPCGAAAGRVALPEAQIVACSRKAVFAEAPSDGVAAWSAVGSEVLCVGTGGRSSGVVPHDGVGARKPVDNGARFGEAAAGIVHGARIDGVGDKVAGVEPRSDEVDARLGAVDGGGVADNARDEVADVQGGGPAQRDAAALGGRTKPPSYPPEQAVHVQHLVVVAHPEAAASDGPQKVGTKAEGQRGESNVGLRV